MARRSGLMATIAREAARQARISEAERKRYEREQIRIAKEQQRQHIQNEKDAKLRYIESRIEETDDLNYELAERIKDLYGILDHTLQVNDMVSFNSLKINEKFRDFIVPTSISVPLTKPQLDDYINKIKSPNLFTKLIPGFEKKYQSALIEAKQQYENGLVLYEAKENERLVAKDRLKSEYDQEKYMFEIKVRDRNLEIDAFEESYRNGEREAIIDYNAMVLERSEYPAGFPQIFRLAYISDSKELVIDYELPNKDIVPTTMEYRYVKTKDEISEKFRKIQEIKNMYSDVVAGVTLRTIHEVLEADQGNVIDVVVFSAYVHSVDPATGKDSMPYLISIRVTKEKFEGLDLNRVEKSVCLRNLGAQVSPRPTELQAVKPILEFDMVDKRFVEHEDMLGSLQGLPNLMELNPYEFEMLVTDLFARMGLDAKLTRSSKDGGVDCVAFDTRPIVGGKVVIQAKRYKNTVGVSAVRDLYGTMLNEGANKGILVTTKSYGPDAYEFAKDKPIELIDGGGLLYLLEKNGINARIIFE
ncbi:restriction endonuclease [Paenibacillus polygoni]|uniref:Restriction endonuclease n=1 Tax=Paenibacillus polygoni TaxID=3050112 RepID=A0ABY8X1L0_9BACL|nr:restriction endonuclease [Paenibacillus polygoni]WIV19401.1 restriction endonuclease [Paenibacillus polygoni]